MTVDQKLDLILEELGVVKAEVKADIAEVKADIVEVKADIAELKKDVSKLKVEMSEVKADVETLNVKVTNMDSKITSIHLDIENEIGPNIMRVAEGHLDLYRKLNDSIKASSDVEAKLVINELYIKRHERVISELERA